MTSDLTSLIDTVKALDAKELAEGRRLYDKLIAARNDRSGGNALLQDRNRWICEAEAKWRSWLGKRVDWDAVQFLEAVEAVSRLTQENERLKMIAQLIGRIYFYGNFKAETFNERQLEVLLREVGCRYLTEDEILNDPVREFLADHQTEPT